MTSNGRAGSTPAFATSVQMMDTSVPIRVHNLADKAVKNLRVKNVTVLMDTHKANAGAKRNNIMLVSTRSFSNAVVSADEQ